jgi:hypothetical protein
VLTSPDGMDVTCRSTWKAVFEVQILRIYQLEYTNDLRMSFSFLTDAKNDTASPWNTVA